MTAPHHVPPPAADRPIDRLIGPFQSFLRIEAAGGILLLASTAIALAWANSPWSQSYHDFWHIKLTLLSVGSLELTETLGHWVSDGLMVVFFLLVGLEIKREILVGELQSMRKAAVPIAAAVGGMAAPAIIYAIANAGQDTLRGWAIPTATDIAFALGVMALLGKRVPVALKVFVTAAAIVDDIGAVLIIAIFYTSELNTTALGVAALAVAALVTMNLLHVRRLVIYAALGVILWVAVLKSGVHATVAGVVLAFTIPARFRIRGADFVDFSRRALDEIVAGGGAENDIMTNTVRQRWLHGLEQACEHIQPPMLRLEHILHPWSSYLIMPIFALANAGITVGSGFGASLASRVGLGVIAGLVLGKQIGIMLASWIVIGTGVGRLPEGTTWKHLYAGSWLTGIGFTMSLFIANLAFGEGEALYAAKSAILCGSLVAGVTGFALLRFTTGDRSAGR